MRLQVGSLLLILIFYGHILLENTKTKCKIIKLQMENSEEEQEDKDKHYARLEFITIKCIKFIYIFIYRRRQAFYLYFSGEHQYSSEMYVDNGAVIF